MRYIISTLAVCSLLVLFSCGKESGDCSADYVGSWSGAINCSGTPADSITVNISELMGDTLSINSNGESLTGVLDSDCNLNLIPTELDLSIFGTITITGSFELRGDELIFMQMRAAGGTEETCTFVGAQ